MHWIIWIWNAMTMLIHVVMTSASMTQTDEEIERAQRASADPLPVAPGEWQGSV